MASPFSFSVASCPNPSQFIPVVNMPITSQLELDLVLPASRPMIPIEVAMTCADRDEDQVLSLIECGKLEWAWDVARHGANRREIRIWRDSLMAFLQGKTGGSAIDAEVIGRILPHSRPELRASEIRHMFCCSQSHISHLVEDGQLTATTLSQRGPLGSAKITRQSIITFLLNRRVI